MRRIRNQRGQGTSGFGGNGLGFLLGTFGGIIFGLAGALVGGIVGVFIAGDGRWDTVPEPYSDFGVGVSRRPDEALVLELSKLF